MNKITNEQLDSLIKSAVNYSGPLPPDEKFSQIISALSELRELRAAMLQGADDNSPVIPDGWKLVPVELTGAMTNAMTDAILDDLHNVDVWRSVLAAAPQQEVKP
ncbi:hypothetical protein ABMH61_000150 [Shigella dysenteriae]